MPDRATSTPRWYALPLLALGAAGFAAAWMLLALALDRQCSWLAPLAALDMALLLKLAKWPAAGSRRALAVAASVAVIGAANALIVAGQIGQSFGLRPWESALKLGPSYAWLLAGMANGGIDLLFYAAALLVAWWAAR
ncbi:hypothetical protein [Thermomonas sp. XSG]|jgi:hypothetical protein|uniref:hypothetical protein n=1 Tax=Thermomonas sp. XSG TaxID=2771436 RepID=UPI00086D0855|nr:hypothetical protein [Thermomonas sp. XSG]ODU53583.1 MAG: hypothetical protein ABS98_00140 [Xanthomonadaceae bacterium SCN 69-48]QNU14592.1 hypothetical protein ICG51_000851 [Thermomonas sp. XSG]